MLLNIFTWIKVTQDIILTASTVNVRKPYVRFGKPDKKVSGFQTSGYRTSEDTTICPVIGRPIDLERLKSGRYVRFSDR